MKKVTPILIISLTLAIGVLLGSIITSNATKNNSTNYSDRTPNDKISFTLDLISSNYVDEINITDITEELMPTILKKLDPHSAYIPAKDLAAMNADLDGKFSGIGVQFNIQEDTIYVVDVISGSPSEKEGLMPGDRIISINDTIFVGDVVNNEKVFNKLRGMKGTKVKVGVVRRNTSDVLHFNITRGDIPVNSVDVAYMITPNIGLIAVNKFGANTYNEFLTGLASLKHSGAKNIIVDLRGNSGGYLDAAINMVNEFLHKGELIVYVEGHNQPRQDSYANGLGAFQEIGITVLIDEFSGSASEIFAGAIQDNDRGQVIGRRSFGKGLVQRPFDLSDGSQIRLTIARYHTPSGRCIQKPYSLGDTESYDSDILERYNHGEFYNADSIQQTDSLIFRTKLGRIVYGGGGIMPDIFVPRDTTAFSPLYFDLLNKSVPYKFAIKYTDDNRAKLNTFTSWQKLYSHLKTQNLFDQIKNNKLSADITFSNEDITTSQNEIEKLTIAYIARNILGDNGFFPIWFSNDITIDKAIKEISNKK